MITDSDRELAGNFVLALSDLDDIDVVTDAIAASRERTEKRGGRRSPPGGRPRKDNAILHCHVPPFVLQEIDKHRGALSRGEYITMLVANAAVDRSNAPDQS